VPISGNPDLPAPDPGAVDPDALDRAIDDLTEDAFRFLERLVAAPSPVGAEETAQQIVRDELSRLGFTTVATPVAEDIAADPVAGVPQLPYAGRHNVVGHLVYGTGPSLILNGHIDVVPAQAQLWSVPPYAAVRRDGWLLGRGAGDMKGGFALAALAIGALYRAAPGWLRGRLTFASVIEEECTGNGTLATTRDGVLADAAVLLEPTDLGLLLGGVGILWAELTVRGLPAHAESAHRAVNPVDFAVRLIESVRALEADMALQLADPFAQLDQACTVNVGVLRAGDWPSSVPGQATVGLRVGFPPSWTPDEALKRVSDVVASAAAGDPWLADHPPQVRASGFRAEGYLLDGGHPLASAMAAAHQSAHGQPPRQFALGSTTDARIYLNQFGVPAVAYGPRARNIHGVDEGVELDSIVAGARTLARFLAGYYAGGGLPIGTSGSLPIGSKGPAEPAARTARAAGKDGGEVAR
jgi:acetylornithine deacetylase